MCISCRTDIENSLPHVFPYNLTCGHVEIICRHDKCFCVQIAGIGVVFAAGATVTNNTVINPVAGISDTSHEYDMPFADPAAIYLDCVSGSITVTDNKFQSVNPLLVGEVICCPSFVMQTLSIAL